MSPHLLPVFLFLFGTSLFLFHALEVRATASTEAMVVYDNQDISTDMKYRIWDGSSWGSEASIGDIGGDPRFAVVKYAPTRNEAVLVTLGSTGGLYAQVYDGTGNTCGDAIFHFSTDFVFLSHTKSEPRSFNPYGNANDS